MRNKRAILLSDVDTLYLSSKKDGAEDKMCKNTVTKKMMGEGTKIVLCIIPRTTQYMRRSRRIRIEEVGDHVFRLLHDIDGRPGF